MTKQSAYSEQDMLTLLGADDNNFPFLVHEKDKISIMIWNKPNGMVRYEDSDPVRYSATIEYLKENAHPEFGSLDEALQYAEDHDWPLTPQ